MNAFLNWLLPVGFMPHGHCYLWRPDVLWLHVGSDALIATSYFAIPVALAYVLRRRRAVLPYWWVPALFAAFIFLCGTTHLLNIWTVWHPDYVVEGLAKLVTGVVSAVTAVTVFMALSQILALRTPIELQREVDERTGELRALNARLRAEITARERTEAALRDSEARLRATFENATVGIAHVAPDGRWLQVNAVWHALTGYSREELLARSFADITHPDDLEKNWEYARRLLAGEIEQYAMEKRYVRKDQSIVWVRLTVSLLRDAAGQPQHFISIVDDITERKRAQEALKASEERLRALADALPALAFAADAHGANSFVNARYERYSGRPAQELLGEGWLGLVHPEDRTAADESWKRSVLTGQPFESEYRIRRDDGSYRWHLVRGEPVRDRSGAVAEWFGTCTDIEAHKRSEAALHEKELRMRLALEASGAATWIIDYTHAAQEQFDARSCELAGIAATQERWPAGTFCALVHPEDRAHMQRTLRETHNMSGSGPRVEYRIVRPDGELRWLQGAGIVQRGSGDQALQLIGVSIDITERKRLEHQLRYTIEKLADADRRKDEFLATLAHELRNPLAPIRNGVQIIKLSSPRDERLRDITQMMERQMSHLVRLVDDLLDVSRITRGKVQLRQERLNLREVLVGALESSSMPFESKRLELDVQMPPEPIEVTGDRDRLTQIFSNILSNAAKYTGAGGRIWLSLKSAGPEAVVSVRDTGIGIPHEALETVFEMFSQLKPSEHGEGGLGIGLALVRQLVQMHGGSVRAWSAGPGKGSEFTVRLPQRAAAATEIARAPKENPDTPAAAASLRVLVVDDNEDAAESLSALLRLLGHDVRVATDGPAALETVTSFAPDVVFMDLGMPGMSGLEAARRIRALGLTRQPLIYALTGWGQDADRERSQQAGFDQHLVKPVELGTLRAMLEGQPVPT